MATTTLFGIKMTPLARNLIVVAAFVVLAVVVTVIVILTKDIASDPKMDVSFSASPFETPLDPPTVTITPQS